MSEAWLSVIGIGEDGLEGVSPIARRLIDHAEILVGGKRHLDMIPDTHKAVRMTWRTPLTQTVCDIAAYKGKQVCVLASGDPMSYGIGVTLGREFGPESLMVLPAPGAFSLAAARMGWPLEETVRLTLHGRPLRLLAAKLQPGARLLILSENEETPGQVADLLTAEGFGGSQITVLEHMGGPKERCLSALASHWSAPPGAALNTIAVTCIADPGTRRLYRGPGLPDEAFHHDGQMTKQEVRAATLAKLMPRSGAMLWDIGAGCGSIAIEWMRMGGRAVAVERTAQRCHMITDNALRLGVPDLTLAEGSAPDILKTLTGSPDAIFLGCGLSSPDMPWRVWDYLAPGGMFVANAVTLESEAVLAKLYAEWGGELARIAVSRLVPVGSYHGWRSMMPVTQYHVRKPE